MQVASIMVLTITLLLFIERGCLKRFCSLPSGPSVSSFSPAPAVASPSKQHSQGPSFQSPYTLAKQHSQGTSFQSRRTLPKTSTVASLPTNPLPSSLGVLDITLSLPDGVQVINLPANVQLVEILSLPNNVNIPSASQNSSNSSNVFPPPLASSTPSFVPASQLISSPCGRTAYGNSQHASPSQARNEGSQVNMNKSSKKINVEINADMLNGCEEDVQGFYFDEFGVSLHGSSAKTAPVERESVPVAATSEDLMKLEAFAGLNHDASFVASQEDSDVKVEQDPQSAKSQMLENLQGTNPHTSDEEITNLSEEFNIVA